VVGTLQTVGILPAESQPQDISLSIGYAGDPELLDASRALRGEILPVG
jgi:hypothetical protein